MNAGRLRNCPGAKKDSPPGQEGTQGWWTEADCRAAHLPPRLPGFAEGVIPCGHPSCPGGDFDVLSFLFAKQSLSAAKEVLVRLSVQGADCAFDIEAVLDTGFNGYLALPAQWIDDLSLTRIGQAEMTLASGEVRFSRKYKATVVFGKEAKPVEVIEAAEPLVGTELLWGYRLRIDFENGGRVEIEALPPSSAR